MARTEVKHAGRLTGQREQQLSIGRTLQAGQGVDTPPCRPRRHDQEQSRQQGSEFPCFQIQVASDKKAREPKEPKEKTEGKKRENDSKRGVQHSLRREFTIVTAHHGLQASSDAWCVVHDFTGGAGSCEHPRAGAALAGKAPLATGML